MMLGAALGFAALCLLASAAPANIEDTWESEAATTCSQNAWTLTGLGAVGIVECAA